MTYQRPRLPSQLTYNDLNGHEAAQILADWFQQLVKSHPLMQPHLTLPMAKLTINVTVGVEMHPGGTIPTESQPDTFGIAGDVILENRVPSQQTLSTVVNAAPVAGGSPPDKIREQHNLPIPTPGYGPRETGSHLFLSDGPASGILDRIIDQAIPNQKAPERSEQGRDSVVASGPGGRQGVVAEGYVFSSEVVNSAPVEQHIDVGSNGGIDIDLSGQGRMRQGDMVFTAGTHTASRKTQGDQGGHKYGSVGATYDLGPAGLARGGGHGLYGDGRPRISYGNNNKG